MPNENRYRAFISYSHADSPIAVRIHRKLEGFRLPNALVGHITARGAVPARLTPIFRDIDELPAANDLTAEIKAALAASDALIVLCSPEAKASQWVAREIALFRELHGDSRPVLPAVVRGQPEAVLPEVLQSLAGDPSRHVHPIAADFRSGRDGFHLAQMKLVAGLTGISLNALVQREAQRKLRRVMAVTAATAVLVVILASALVFAIRARKEAEVQRAEAEGLIEYMLTDLRDRLKGVGRLDVMTAVNERAILYYGDQNSLEGLGPDSLERRSRVLHAMGEEDQLRGELTQSARKFREAHRTTAAVLQQRPNDPSAIFAHAQSEYWVGRIAELQKDWPEALSHYEGYAAAAANLRRVEPDTVRSHMETAWGHLNIGIVTLSGLTKPQDAARAFSEAIRWFDLAAAKAPTVDKILYELANAHGWRADALHRQKDLNGALAERLIENRILLTMAKRLESNAQHGYLLAQSEQAVGKMYGQLSKPSEAIIVLIRANGRADRLLAIDPENVHWRHLALRIKSGLARRQFEAGNRAEAIRWSDAALAQGDAIRQRTSIYNDMIKRVADELQQVKRGDLK